MGRTLDDLAGWGAVAVLVAVLAVPFDPFPQESIPLPTPAPAAAPAELVEGHDFDFYRTTDGRPIRWSCAAPIRVTIGGDAPDGAADAVAEAVDRLAYATGLPLRAAGLSLPPGQITITYVPSSDTRIASTALGTAETRWAGLSGQIRSSSILIKRDSPAGDPESHAGQQVLLHELAHAVGLAHAADKAREVMAGTYRPDLPLGFGRGDSWALGVVGCSGDNHAAGVRGRLRRS